MRAAAVTPSMTRESPRLVDDTIAPLPRVKDPLPGLWPREAAAGVGVKRGQADRSDRPHVTPAVDGVGGRPYRIGVRRSRLKATAPLLLLMAVGCDRPVRDARPVPPAQVERVAAQTTALLESV